MQFWDSSAIVQLLVEQHASKALRAALERDPHLWVWWGSEIECVSALSRLLREAQLDEDEFESALELLDSFREAWHEVEPTHALKLSARRLLRVHPLRAADSLQLSAALQAADHQPAGVRFISFDEKLTAAARKEGFVTSFG